MDRQKCCVKLSVRPTRGLLDEKFTVLVQNVPPGFQLTLRAQHKCEDGHSWEAFGHYTADASGSVNGGKLSSGTFWTLVMELSRDEEPRYK